MMEEIFEDLSGDEIKLLKRKIKEIENAILKKLWGTIKTLTIIVAFILTVGGIISFSGIRDSIIDSASVKLKEDASLRTEIVESVKEDITHNVSSEIEEIQDLVSKVNELSRSIEKERREAQDALSRDLRIVRNMLEKIYFENYDQLDTLR
jgi:cell division protein FtsX